jgi:alanyl-tRNA synthetase
MKSSEIRQAFLAYFSEKQHQVVASSSLVPGNDPTLLFTNAGMVQFKESFLGLESRPYSRAVSSQRCVRAGGKHNDLENVGYTARHHTFFEMLGNFSFGDYFKREAIAFAWEFLTKKLGLPESRLWVTVYQDDNETADIWLKEMGVSAERFSRCGEKDNFWSMGDTGPCGPCTEIFYDHGPDIAGGPPGSPDEDGDRYIEIWNLVFMQFNRDKSGVMHPLPKPSVDTGMGLERIAAVVQGVHSNYEIDSFQYIIKAIASKVPTVDPDHTSFKVIADHIRACAFLIADGVMPGNEGRGYVLRRIIRRAVRHGNALALPTPFFCTLVEPLTMVMGDAYPELIACKGQIEQILEQEENQFARTLDQGLKLLQEAIQQLQGKIIPGDVAFKLYDTYGFPVDLTADIGREQGLAVDMDGFQTCMQKQRELSQSASQFQVDYNNVASTFTQRSDFHGYEKNSLESKVSAILVEGVSVENISEGMKAAVILDHTPFYAESGGQVGDQGFLVANALIFKVYDTQRRGDAIVHHGELMQGSMGINQTITAKIDENRRNAIRLNHTATHLLHAALKQLLGTHVQQKGSLVDAERARFDFSHYEALTAAQITQMEALVNEKIRENTAVQTEIMDIEAAKKSGAMALFGEKYSESVRVLTMGDFSKELCGGTHAKNTGDIGLFKIITEYGVASGVRRIEMVTGAYALEWVNQQIALLQSLAVALKTTPALAMEKFSQFFQDMKQQEKEISRLQLLIAQKSSSDLMADVQKIGDIQFLIKQLESMDSNAMRTTMDQLKSTMESAVIVLYAKDQEKINVIAGVSKNLLGRVPPAPAYVKHLCGKGGGREDMAQGGGPVPNDLEVKIAEMKGWLETSREIQ